MHSWRSIFRWAKPMPSEVKSLDFNSSRMKPFWKLGRDSRNILQHAPTTAWWNGWLFRVYSNTPAQNHIDAASGGSFLSLSVPEAKALVEKIASNQSWKGDRQQQPAREFIRSIVSICLLPRWTFSWRDWSLRTRRLTKLWILAWHGRRVEKLDIWATLARSPRRKPNSLERTTPTIQSFILSRVGTPSPTSPSANSKVWISITIFSLL